MNTDAVKNEENIGVSDSNARLGGWLPIETAPKDARILLGYENKIFNGIFSVCGNWDKDEYANNPKPYWTNDMDRLRGKRETKAQQPIGWMPLPNPPNVEVRGCAIAEPSNGELNDAN